MKTEKVQKFRFIRNDFKKYLENNLDTEFDKCDPRECPISKFLQTKERYYFAAVYPAEYRLSYNTEWKKNPKWMKKFIELFDFGDEDTKTGSEALQILKEIECHLH